MRCLTSRLAARYRVLDGAAKGLGLDFGAGITALSPREPNPVQRSIRTGLGTA